MRRSSTDVTLDRPLACLAGYLKPFVFNNANSFLDSKVQSQCFRAEHMDIAKRIPNSYNTSLLLSDREFRTSYLNLRLSRMSYMYPKWTRVLNCRTGQLAGKVTSIHPATLIFQAFHRLRTRCWTRDLRHNTPFILIRYARWCHFCSMVSDMWGGEVGRFNKLCFLLVLGSHCLVLLVIRW